MSTDRDADEIITTIQIMNSATHTIILRLEPWADELEMSSGAIVEVVARGPQGGVLQVEYGDNEVAVYGWVGSTVDISEAGT